MVTNNEAVQLLLLPKNVNSNKENPRHLNYLNEFRTQQCLLFLVQQCQFHRPYTCFHWHFPNQKRRRPYKRQDGTFNYNPDVYCDKYDETIGSCVDGEECPYAHRNAGDTERRYHPRYFKTGNCIYETTANGGCVKNGLHCAFAHGPDDVRLPVYDIREVQDASSRFTVNLPASLEKERVLSEDPKWNEMFHVLACYKTELCRKPPRMCRQGYSCPFYHNGKDKRRAPDRWRYRSTPCPLVRPNDEWQDSSICESGDDCSYCHTRTEQQFHPEIYKSNKCNDVVNSGYCPRGPFCAFAHCDSEMKMGRDFLIKVQLQQQQHQQHMLTYVSKAGGGDYQLTGDNAGEPIVMAPPGLFASTLAGGLNEAFAPSTAAHHQAAKSLSGHQKQVRRQPATSDSRKASSAASVSSSLVSPTGGPLPAPTSVGGSPLMLLPASVQRVSRRLGRCPSPQQQNIAAAWQSPPASSSLLQQQSPQPQQLSFVTGSLSPSGNSSTLISPRSVAAHQTQQLANALQLPFYSVATAPPPPALQSVAVAPAVAAQQQQQRLSNHIGNALSNPFTSPGLSRDLKAPGSMDRHRSGNSVSFSEPTTSGGGVGGPTGANRHHLIHSGNQQPKLSLDHLISPHSPGFPAASLAGGRRYPVDSAGGFSSTYPGGKFSAGTAAAVAASAMTAQPMMMRSSLLQACLSPPTEDNFQLMTQQQQHQHMARSTPRKLLQQQQLTSGSGGAGGMPCASVSVASGVNPLAIGRQGGLIDMTCGTTGSVNNSDGPTWHRVSSGLQPVGNPMTMLSPGEAVAAAASLWGPTSSAGTPSGGPEGPIRPPADSLYSTAVAAWPWHSPHSPSQLLPSSTALGSGALPGLPSDSGHNSETSATELDLYAGCGTLFEASSFLEEHKRDSGLALDYSLPASLSFADAGGSSSGVGFAAEASGLGVSGHRSESSLQQLASYLSTIGPTSGCSEGAVTAFRQLFPYDQPPPPLAQSRFESDRILTAEELAGLEPSGLLQSPASSSSGGDTGTTGLVSFPMAIPGRCEADSNTTAVSAGCCYAELASNGATTTMVTCSPLSSSSCCSSSSSILQQQHHHQQYPSRRTCHGCILSTPQNTTSWPVASSSCLTGAVQPALLPAASTLTDSSFPAQHNLSSVASMASSLNHHRQPYSSVLSDYAKAGSCPGDCERSDLMAAVSGVCPLATSEIRSTGKPLLDNSRSPSPAELCSATTATVSSLVPGVLAETMVGKETGKPAAARCGVASPRPRLDERSSFANLPQSPILMSSPFSNPGQDLERLTLQRQLNEVRERLDVREEELESLKRQRDVVTEHLRDSLDVIRQLFSSFHLPLAPARVVASSSTPGGGEARPTDLSQPLYVDTSADAAVNFGYAGGGTTTGTSDGEADASVKAEVFHSTRTQPEQTAGADDGHPPPASLGKSQVELQQEALAALFSNPMIAALLESGNGYPELNDLLLLHASYATSSHQQHPVWSPPDYETQQLAENNELSLMAPVPTTPTVTLTTSKVNNTTATSSAVHSNPTAPSYSALPNDGLLADSDEADDLLSSASSVRLFDGDHQQQQLDGAVVSASTSLAV